jgi:dethiobiotin synthetase
MSDTPMKLVVDLATGVTAHIPLTAEEIEQRELDAIQAATQQAEREVAEQAKAELKASAKAKLVAGEPLTAEEAETLVI